MTSFGIAKKVEVSAMRFLTRIVPIMAAFALVVCGASIAGSQLAPGKAYDPGRLKATDSQTTLKVGDPAPDFELPSIAGEKVSLSGFRGKNNVVLSFVPAAWTPVCSEQWPGYNVAEDLFKQHDAVLLGIAVDNIPTLHAWVKEMGMLHFPVMSDFWPHGEVSHRYGVLRTDGTSERALFVIDKNGIVRFVDVYDINEMPRLDRLAEALKRLPK